MCGGRVDVWWFRFGCVVVFFVGWIWIYGTWVFGVDLWWLLEKIFDVWWFWSPGFGCVVVVWMCGGLDLVVWWFSLLVVGWILIYGTWIFGVTSGSCIIV